MTSDKSEAEEDEEEEEEEVDWMGSVSEEISDDRPTAVYRGEEEARKVRRDTRHFFS